MADEQSGADTMTGGNDTLAGADTLAGGADTLGQDTTAGGSGDDTLSSVEPTWPEDWRDRFSGKDDKAKRILGRYSTPENVAKAYLSLRTQLDSGEYKRHSLPDGAKDEDVAAYRKAWGIPDTPEGYAEGREFDENDKAVLGSFTALAHEKHLPKAAVDVAFDWYKGFMDETRAAQAEFDNQRHAEAEDALRAEWGAEYRSVNNATTNLLKSAGLEGLLEARMADGTRLADSVEARKWLSQVADAMNPALRLTGGTGSTATLEAEYEELRTLMRADPHKYHGDPKNSARFFELTAQLERVKAA